MYFNVCVLYFTDFFILFFFSFFTFTGLSTAAIRNVSLQVDPPSVRRGQHATFICSYDLDGAPLYSVKFYRGNHEFYRYSPSELPMSKVFQFVGFNVDVSLIQLFFNFIYKIHHIYLYIFYVGKPMEYISTEENERKKTIEFNVDLNGFITNNAYKIRYILSIHLDVFIDNQISISRE